MIKRNFLKLAGAVALSVSFSQIALAETTLKVGSWLPPYSRTKCNRLAYLGRMGRRSNRGSR